jgi:hypothetical protein
MEKYIIYIKSRGREGVVRTISENAFARPYHCASYCRRPWALVRGLLNFASSCVGAGYYFSSTVCVKR